MSQSELVHILKVLIDDANGSPVRAETAKMRLSVLGRDERIFTSHVQHNIGKRRAAWLAAFLEERQWQLSSKPKTS